jgi:N-acetylneuraminic acid mutarotase
VYAIAGRAGGLDTNLVAVESFDPAAFNGGWRNEPALAVPRGGIAAATVGDTICVAGGEAPSGTIASVECLRNGAWRNRGDLSEARHGLGVVAGDDGRLHVLAGGPQPGLFVSTAHEIVQIDGN